MALFCLISGCVYVLNDLVDVELPDLLEQSLKVWNVEPRRIQIEITETAIFDNADRAADTLYRLRQMGFRIALDDFGTGYSSLSYLHRLHLRTVKIDRSLVSQFGDRRAETICAHVVRLAHDLGLVVVAEGIEDPGTLELVRRLGCETAQGFHLWRGVSELGGSGWGAGTVTVASTVVPETRGAIREPTCWNGMPSLVRSAAPQTSPS